MTVLPTSDLVVSQVVRQLFGTNLAMSTISERSNEASILAFFNIEVKQKWLIPIILKIEAKLTLLIQELTKIEAKRPQLIPDIRNIEAKRTLPRSLGIDSKELILPAGGPEPIFVDV